MKQNRFSEMSTEVPARQAELNGRETGPEHNLIVYLARTVLERLEAMESESRACLKPGPLVQEVEEETRVLFQEISGLKARLKWIAEGM